MGAIYQPKGKAREYSPLALNIYNGCDHACRYCYVPKITRRTYEDYSSKVKPKSELFTLLEKDLRKPIQHQVLLSFAGDPYCRTEQVLRCTRRALGMLKENGAPVALLSKGGARMLDDFDLIRSFGERIKVGATIIYASETYRNYEEPGAASIDERIATLRHFHDAGIRTWVSLEPVIDPGHALCVINDTIDVCDEYRIGKINYNRKLEDAVDWSLFLDSVLRILRPAGKKIYIKRSLQDVCQDAELYPHEIDFNFCNVRRAQPC